jgi:leader peptidase (prepilin peptidase)/N-methyltransferase
MLEILQSEFPMFSYTLLALFFLAIGSLLNVIIHRLPLMLEAEWKMQCEELLKVCATEKKEKINLFFPRSFCPSCKKMIKAWQNIPIISYLFLKGRCYYCKSPISIRYPFVELLTMLLSLYSIWHFGFNLTAVFSLFFIWVCISLIFIDLDHQLLPDSLSLSLLWLGLIANCEQLFTSLPNAVLSAAAAWLFLWLFIKIFYLITGKIGMGHGDFKLFAAFAAWFGWSQLPLILILSSFSGAVTGYIYLKAKNQPKDSPIPFGPFLAGAGIISLFWGQSIINYYLSFFFVA